VTSQSNELGEPEAFSGGGGTTQRDVRPRDETAFALWPHAIQLGSYACCRTVAHAYLTCIYTLRFRIFNMVNQALWTPLDVPNDGLKPFTDYSRWRLRVSDGGRHTWHYLQTDEEMKRWPQTALDKYWLGLPTVCTI
jgi:hypothetical protein